MSRTKRLLFTLVAVVAVPTVFLAVLEAGLRIAGVGFDPSFFLSQRIDGERVLTDNPRFGGRFFPPAIARAPLSFVIPERKPVGTVRVFVLGGSAAMGDPAPPSGLPRVLQAQLESVLPGRKVEVVNAAMTAINSHVVLPIARECVQRDADVLVVYLGNNEVVGPFGAGSVFGIPGAELGVIRVTVAAKSTRVGQLVEALGRGLRRSESPGSWGGMELFLGTQLPLGDPRLERVYRHYRENLADICDAAQAAGVPVVLSTVGVNERDCAPFASANADSGAWADAFGRGVRAQDAGDPDAAAPAFAEAASLDDASAELRYRAGRVRLALSDSAGAVPELRAAVDRDLLRFRADSRIREIVKEVAEGREGVVLVDGAEALRRASPGGTPGAEFFDDHVHLRFEGNWELGRAVTSGVLRALKVPASELGPRLTRDEGARRLAEAPWRRIATVRTMRARRALAPFAGGLDEAEWEARTAAEIDALEPRTQVHFLRRALDNVRAQLRRHPDDIYLQEDLAELLVRTGEPAAALQVREALAARFPHSADAAYRLGITRLAAGDAAAAAAFREAIDRNPRHFLARNELGLILLEEDRVAEAEDQFRRAVADHPRLAVAHRNLGTALSRLGRKDEAADAYAAAIRANPELASAHKRLGDLLAEQGETAAARAAYRRALELNPSYHAAREKLQELR